MGFTGDMKFLEKCLTHLSQSFAAMPDKRAGSNRQYFMEDVGMGAFSVFFMQQPSFLAFQRTLHQNMGRDNTQTLFGMNRIPTDNHIRNMLDGIPPSHFVEDYFFIIDELASAGVPVVCNSMGHYTLIALDGSEYYCSKKLWCPNCNTRLRSDGELEYFHSFFAASIVKPGKKEVFSLPPEFITPQDGTNKHDCEWNAAKRWLNRFSTRCAKYNPVYLGDDLYAKHEICLNILQSQGHFIFTCKDTSHKTLLEYRKGLVPEMYHEIKGTGSQRREYSYSWLRGLPIRDGKDAVVVNWINVKISLPGGRTTYNASFITDLHPDAGNIVELAACARARWKIENETFNVLKNKGYHLEHNFGHGKQTLSSVLVALNLIAFSLHAACDACEPDWQKAREICGARNRMFTILWSLTAYLVFPTWSAFLKMVATGRPPPP